MLFRSLQELIKEFDYHHVNKAPAVFDMVKLRWMNSEYIKAMDNESFYEMAMPYYKEVIKNEGLDARKILDLVKTRIEVFPDIKEHIDFFESLPDYNIEMYTHKKMKTNPEISLEVLTEMLPILEETEDFSIDNLHNVCMRYIENKGIKNGTGLWPIRTAVSGKQMTPGGAFEIMEILGKAETIRRIKIGIEKLSE